MVSIPTLATRGAMLITRGKEREKRKWIKTWTNAFKMHLK